MESNFYDSVLAYLAIKLIKSYHDYHSKVMEIDAWLKPIDMYYMYFGLIAPLLEFIKAVDGIWAIACNALLPKRSQYFPAIQG